MTSSRTTSTRSGRSRRAKRRRSRLLTVLRLLARLATDRGDDESAGQYLGQLLERDRYDEDAWLALIAGQLRLRRHGEARRRYAAYARRMGELDVVPVALANAATGGLKATFSQPEDRCSIVGA